MIVWWFLYDERQVDNQYYNTDRAPIKPTKNSYQNYIIPFCDSFRSLRLSFLKAVIQCETYCSCEVDASFVLLLEADIGWLLVKSDAKALQLVFYQLLVAKRLQHIEHYQD